MQCQESAFNTDLGQCPKCLLRAVFRESVACLSQQRPRSLVRFRVRICDLCWEKLSQKYVFLSNVIRFPTVGIIPQGMCSISCRTVFCGYTTLSYTRHINSRHRNFVLPDRKISILDPHTGIARVAYQLILFKNMSASHYLQY